MSSDGSASTTSSRIRQFGLYRSIDARTEEFLRLSRKRQIRQGCACAAISTIITVTIVIIIILVYEYSILPVSISKTTEKSNWLGVMNSTADTTFDPKFNTAKITLDPSSNQLLPLLLKTLKQSGFYEQSREESSSSTVLEKKGSMESYPKNNIFTEFQSWMRLPVSRMYAIEYKTPPIFYFKYPTRSNDYITKIRKIRDYQRMLNYVDKMISEKVTYGSTQPIRKSGYNYVISKNSMYTTPMSMSNDMIKTKDKKIHTPKPNCMCPLKFKLILSKLIKSLQRVLPEISSNSSEHLAPCKIKSDNNMLMTKLNKNKIKTEFIKIGVKENAYLDDKCNKSISKTYKKHSIKNGTTELNQIPVYNFDKNDNHSSSKIISLLKPKRTRAGVSANKESNSKINNIVRKVNFDGMKNVAGQIKKPLSFTERNVISKADYIYRHNETKLTKLNDSLSEFPRLGSDENIDDADKKNIIDKFDFLDSYSTELLKTKYIPRDSKSSKTNTRNKTLEHNSAYSANIFRKSKIDFNNTSQKDATSINATKFIQTDTKLTITSLSNSYFSNFTYMSNEKLDVTSTVKYGDIISIRNESLILLQPNNSTPNPKVQDKYLLLHKSEESDDVTFEKEIEKVQPENPEFYLRNMENMIKHLNDKLDKNSKKVSSVTSRSMLPRNRPSYLKIQKDWKYENSQDYDASNIYQSY